MTGIRLRSGTAEASVDPPAGGRLVSLVAGGRERLVTEPDPTAPLPPITWGSFAMLPWVGRMAGGRLDWHGTTTRLPVNLGAHAIHGVAFDLAWRVIGRDDRSVELACDLGAGGWPFGGTASQTIRLGPDSLDQAITVYADGPTPVAIGWHPWFRREPGERIEVVVPADRVLETTDDLIPTGRVVPVAGPTDLRMAVDLGDRSLDHAYVGVTGRCIVRWPDLAMSIAASPLGSVLVHAIPSAFCVEPQTAWPDAIRGAGAGFDTGLVELAAGDRLRATTRWEWTIP